MIRLVAVLFISFASLALCERSSAQESQAAKTTRKALQKTLDVDQKDIGTKDFLDDISSDLDNKVKFKIDNASGVSNNTKMTYKAKGVTVEKMLNDLADKYDWGWFVMSNAGNNAVDGKVIIRKSSKGKERGYETGKEPKKSASLDRPSTPREPAAFVLMGRVSEPPSGDRLGTGRKPVLNDRTDAAKKDLDKLQGQWVIAALEVNGVDVPPDKLEGTVLTIKDDGYSVKLKDSTIVCKLTLDPAKDPKEFDMLFLDGANKDRTQKGIYKFEGDNFKFVRGIAPEQERPRDFATGPNSNYFMVTWKKK
jgi:uncharacterized protein (TIGR03067 family)